MSSAPDNSGCRVIMFLAPAGRNRRTVRVCRLNCDVDRLAFTKLLEVMQSSGGALASFDFQVAKRRLQIVRAQELRQRLEQEGTSLDELAQQEGCSRPYISSMIKLAYLALGVTQAILDGIQPTSLTLADLMKRDVPVNWTDQRRAFGFL